MEEKMLLGRISKFHCPEETKSDLETFCFSQPNRWSISATELGSNLETDIGYWLFSTLTSFWCIFWKLSTAYVYSPLTRIYFMRDLSVLLKGNKSGFAQRLGLMVLLYVLNLTLVNVTSFKKNLPQLMSRFALFCTHWLHGNSQQNYARTAN